MILNKNSIQQMEKTSSPLDNKYVAFETQAYLESYLPISNGICSIKECIANAGASLPEQLN